MDEDFYRDTPSRKQRVRDIQGDDATGDLFAVPAVQSPTSQAAAAQVNAELRAKRIEQARLLFRAAGADGLARFELAARLGKEQHEITSTVAALLAAKDIYELTRTRYNARTKKHCAVLVWKDHYSRSAA